MNINDLVRDAAEAIGRPEKDDWIIAPTRHAEIYRERAPALSEILAGSEILAIAEQYEKNNQDANTAQARFKKFAGWANLAVFATACISALVLVANGLDLSPALEPSRKISLAALGIVAILVGGLGTMFMYQIQAGRFLEEWKSRRAKADTHRMEWFRIATRVPAQRNEPSKIPLALLQLEYFRRYQLDAQISYYQGASRRHDADARKTLFMSAIAIFLGTIATGLSGILGSIKPGLAGFASLGVIGVALSSFAAAKEGIGQDRRNAERYDQTSEALVELSKKLDAVRQAAAQGNQEPMEEFVSAVHDHLSAEHRQWLKGTESAQEALSKLQKALEKHEEK